MDRLVAVTVPVRHSTIMTKRTSVGLVVLFWLPSIGFTLHHWISIALGEAKVSGKSGGMLKQFEVILTSKIKGP